MADSFTNLATRADNVDANSAADINTLMANIRMGSLRPWVTLTAYTVGQVVRSGNTTWICMTAHTAGTFVDDLALLRWEQMNQDSRSKIINGAMQVAQEQTTVNLTGTQDEYVCDNFKFSQSLSAGECTVSRSTEAPDGFYYSTKVDITQIDASIAIGEFAHFTAFVEGYDYASLKDGEVTRGFWVRSSKTGTFCVSVMNNGSDRSYVSDITISVADTWEYKTVTITLDQTGGTENYITGIGIQLLFTLACGSTFQTTADAWQTGEFYASASQDNWFDHVDNDFYITGVQLNLGSTALPFQHEDYATVLTKCYRYFRPATGFSGLINAAGTQAAVFIHLEIELRVNAVFYIKNGTGAWHEPGIAFRNVTGVVAPIPKRGGYANLVIAGATPWAIGNIQGPGKIFIDCRF